MTKISMLFLFGILTISSISSGLVFETDQRIDVSESKDSSIKTLAKSVFTFVPKSKLIQQKDGSYKFIETIPLKALVNLCPNEPFADEMTIGSRCSGFLVSSSLGITAGHCVSPLAAPNFCQDYFIVFDYIRANGITPLSLPAGSVQTCSTIKKIDFSNTDPSDDYAILKLSKTINDRKPLKYRKSGKIQNNEGLFMLGYPRGMSQKISEGRFVVKNTDKSSFSTNLDCFHGNSGSPVFNSKTYQVEGLFVRGDGSIPNQGTDPNLVGDFFSDTNLKCNKTLVCKKSEGCTGVMDATRITRILR